MTKIAAGLFIVFFASFVIRLGVSYADAPVVCSGGAGGPNLLAPERDACWSEPPDLNGMIGSSEQMTSFGLDSEIANDFVPSGSMISKASWGWAWFDESACDQHPATPGFNLRFYEAGNCVPGALIADLSITTYTEESLGCQTQHGIEAMYKETTDIAVNVVAGQTYWCGVQVKDHDFPPQAGRLGTGAVTGCPSAFKGAYFGFPEWTPTSQVWGTAWDASQEFVCGVTPVETTSWGQVKAIFR